MNREPTRRRAAREPAGAQVTAVIHGTHELGPWPGFGLMCLFIAAAMAAAFLLLPAVTPEQIWLICMVQVA